MDCPLRNFSWKLIQQTGCWNLEVIVEEVRNCEYILSDLPSYKFLFIYLFIFIRIFLEICLSTRHLWSDKKIYCLYFNI